MTAIGVVETVSIPLRHWRGGDGQHATGCASG